MSVTNFQELESHIGHDVVVVGYRAKTGKPFMNVAIECETCNEVLLDFDRPIPNERLADLIKKKKSDKTLTRLQKIIQELSNSELYKIEEMVAHEIRLSESAIEEGHEKRR
jgi:hypothetical protein